jgi:hypothetical protein
MSAAGVISLPSTCSGAMYEGLPTTPPSPVMVGSVALAGRAPAEIGDHGARAAGSLDQHDVGRLEVAVDDALLVRRVEGGGHLRHQRGRLGVSDAADAHEARRQRLALEELHGEEGDVVAPVARPVQPDVEDAADVGVGHLARELDLALEALEHLGIEGGDVVADGLEGHPLPEQEVLGLVDLAHPTLAEHAQDLVALGDEVAAGEPLRDAGRPRAREAPAGVTGSARPCVASSAASLTLLALPPSFSPSAIKLLDPYVPRRRSKIFRSIVRHSPTLWAARRRFRHGTWSQLDLDYYWECGGGKDGCRGWAIGTAGGQILNRLSDIELLQALVRKYRTLAELRRRRDQVKAAGGVWDVEEGARRRAAFRRLAEEFPGALRELELPVAALEARAAATEEELAAARGWWSCRAPVGAGHRGLPPAPSPTPWMPRCGWRVAWARAGSSPTTIWPPSQTSAAVRLRGPRPRSCTTRPAVGRRDRLARASRNVMAFPRDATRLGGVGARRARLRTAIVLVGGSVAAH